MLKYKHSLCLTNTIAMLSRGLKRLWRAKIISAPRSSNSTIGTHIACKRNVRNIVMVSLKNRVGMRHPDTLSTKELDCWYVSSQDRNYSDLLLSQVFPYKWNRSLMT